MSEDQNVTEAPAAEAPVAEASAAAAPVKRRPGRPRKRPVAEDAAGAEAAGKQEAPANAEEAPKTPAKRRPGRPRKKIETAPVGEHAAEKAEAAAADQEKPAQPAENSEVEKPARKTRTRRTRVKRDAAEESAEVAMAAEPAAAAAAADEALQAKAEHKAFDAPATDEAPAKAQDAPQGEAAGEAADAKDAQDMAPGRAARAARTPRKSVRASGSAHADRDGRKQRDGGERAEGRNDKNNRHSNDRNDRDQRDQRNDRKNRNDKNNRHDRHQRNNNREVVPSVTKEDLAKLKVAELRAKAAELDVDVAGLKKAELVDAVFDATMKAEGFIEVEGILDILQDGYGFLRTNGYLPSEQDCYVGLSTIRRNGLRKGDKITGTTRPARPNEKYAAVQKVLTINGVAAEEVGKRVRFGDLTPVYPDECLTMEHGKSTITARVIDLVSPIGKGQRGLIVSPPKAGKTTILKDIAAAISANNPEVHLMCLLVDERPEEVTDMQRSIKGEVISSTFDMPTENHIQVSELVIERAKRLVEDGKDVVVLLDSLTRLARAYNLAQPASGRILSGGVDSTALYPPKKFLGAARNIEGGGSLTILASALVETGSKMDEVIFEEFKGTGNMELKLDRNLADRRIFPAIDPVASGTRKEDLLLNPQEAPLIWAVRRILANTNNTERAMDMLIKSLKRTNDNAEFLMRAAKKAQHSNGVANLDF
ncbi:transcription termination factor Rho [Senegalimassilia faecalis]|uniref:transcription termination factor Rho n=1 Tax=Senegalimassilia faecalis TaxID=2509433 RepID=UPI003A9745CD